MRAALGIVAAVLLALLGLVLFLIMLNATGLPVCEDRAAVIEAGECIEASSAERTLGLIVGWAATACAALAFALSIGFSRTGRGAGRLAVAAVLTPVLGFVALLLLPVSF